MNVDKTEDTFWSSVYFKRQRVLARAVCAVHSRLPNSGHSTHKWVWWYYSKMALIIFSIEIIWVWLSLKGGYYLWCGFLFCTTWRLVLYWFNCSVLTYYVRQFSPAVFQSDDQFCNRPSAFHVWCVLQLEDLILNRLTLNKYYISRDCCICL